MTSTEEISLLNLINEGAHTTQNPKVYEIADLLLAVFFFNLFILTYETISLKFYLRHSRHVREIHRDRSDIVGKTGNKKFTAASHICSYISPTIFVKNFGIYSLNRGIYCDSVKEVDIALQLNFPERQSPWTSFYHTSSNCKRFHCHTTLRIRIP
jgi:hypothetical protein